MKVKKNNSKVPIISILGCGWLGLPLAKNLIKLGYIIKGSTTDPKKCSILKNSGIDAYNIMLTPKGIKGDIDVFLRKSDILILNIPPKFRSKDGEDYIKSLEKLCNNIDVSSITKILFVSSTSVYKDGPDFPIVTEDSNSLARSAKANMLLSAESLFTANSSLITTIVRFSGLLGEERHPAFHLSGRSNIADPHAPVNLIHLDDCIAIITEIINRNLWGEIFNASNPFSPPRMEYYTKVCSILNIAPPSFDCSKISRGKLVSSEKLIRLLNYEFRFPIC